MEENDMFILLTSLEIDVAYDHFDNDDEQPPFILYRNTDPDLFGADDKIYYKSNSYIIDYIDIKKNVTNEKKIEKLFDDNNICYEKTEDFIDSEKIYQIRYFI